MSRNACVPIGAVLVATFGISGSGLRSGITSRLQETGTSESESLDPLRVAIDRFGPAQRYSVSASKHAAIDTLPVLGDDALWWDGFFGSGAQGPVGDMESNGIGQLEVYHGRLIAAGGFAAIDGVQASGLASWDGHRWEPLGNWDPTRPDYYPTPTIGVHDDELIVAMAPKESAPHVLRRVLAWSGEQWRLIGDIGGPRYQYVRAIRTWQDDLLVGGHFPGTSERDSSYVLRWNGSGWTPIPAIPSSHLGSCYAMTDHDGSLLAGGWNLGPIGDARRHLALFDGTTWEPLGKGVNGPVYAIAEYRGEVVVGGNFTQAGSSPASCVAAWDGSRWSALGEGLRGRHAPAPIVFSLCRTSDSLLVGGIFDSAGAAAAQGVAVWSGSDWHSLPRLGEGFVAVETLARYGDQLIAAGQFWLGDGFTNGESIAAWDGSRWLSVGSPRARLAATPTALLAGDDGVYVAALFRDEESYAVAWRVGRWGGTNWQLIGPSFDGPVTSLGFYRGRLVAGGRFTQVGNVPARSVAMWTGNAWTPLGTGFSGVVYALQEYVGRLVAAGRTDIRGERHGFIREWDGAQWSTPGSMAFPGWTPYYVLSMAVYQGRLVASGWFPGTAEGEVMEDIAQWDGRNWSPLGEGLESQGEVPVDELTVHRGRLIAHGSFRNVGGSEPVSLATWDGIAWAPLRRTFTGTILRLGTYRGWLVAGGNFGDFDFGAGHLLAWDGDRWFRLGSGTSYGTEGFEAFPAVTAIEEWNGSLFVAGNFNVAGGRPSFRIGRWDGSAVIPSKAASPFVALGNPVRGRATLEWFLDAPSRVRIDVFDLAGRWIARLLDKTQGAGTHVLEWEPRDSNSRRFSTGVLFLRLQTDQDTRRAKIVVLE